MPITQSNTFQGADFMTTDLIAATTSTSFSFAHGLGAIDLSAGLGALAPLFVTFTPLNNDYYLSRWFLVSITATTVTVQKATTSLSGGAARQVRVNVSRPHSIGR